MVKQNKLSLVFSDRKILSTKFFQNLIKFSDPSKYIIVFDINRTWTAASVQDNVRIIHPQSIDALLHEIVSLGDMISPRTSLVIFDHLLIYFRDFHKSGDYGIQNLRSYAFTLSVLKKISEHLPVIFSSFAQGIDIEKPLMYEISNYYCDIIAKLEFNTDYKLIKI